MAKNYLKNILSAFAVCSLSTMAVAADYSLPFTFETTPENFNKCVVDDVNNDAAGNYGKWSYYVNSFSYQCNDNSSNPADDWIFLPIVDFGNATEVTVSFEAKVAMAKYPESFEVYLGKSQDKDAMTVAVGKEVGFQETASKTFSYTVTVPVSESSDWCLGFHAVSQPNMLDLYISNIKIVKSAGGDIQTIIPSAPVIKESAMDYLNYTATVQMPDKDTEGADITGSMTLNVFVDDESVESYSDLTAGAEKNIALTLTAGEHTIAYQAVLDGETSASASETVTAAKKVIVPGVPLVGEGVVTGMSYTVQVTMPSKDTEDQAITEKMSLKVAENDVVLKTFSNLEAGATEDVELSLGVGVHTLAFYAVIDDAKGEAVEKEVTIVEPSYSLPFSFQPSADSIKECVVVDANGDEDENGSANGVWKISDGAFCYTFSSKNNADDWVILPFVEVGETRNITVSVSVKTGNLPEAFELKLGNGRTISAMTETVTTRNEFKTDNKEYVNITADVVLPESDSDKWALGIHATSPFDMAFLYFKDIEIYDTPTEDQIPSSPVFVEGNLEDNVYTATLRMPTETATGAPIDPSARMTLKVTVDSEEATTKENLAPGAETEVVLTLDAGRHVILFSVVLDNAESEAERKIVTVKNSAVTTGNLPYKFTVTQDSFNDCIFVDVNSDGEENYGKGMWTYQYRYDNGGGAFKYFAGSTDADDWIILPMVNFGTSKGVVVSMNVETDSDPESFEVYLGKERTVEAMTLPVMNYTDFTHAGSYETLSASVALPESADGNEWCVGIRAVSPADHYVFYINEIQIKQDSTTGINTIATEESGEAEYYDLQGMRINSPEAGSIVIVRKAGNTYKTVVR